MLIFPCHRNPVGSVRSTSSSQEVGKNSEEQSGSDRATKGSNPGGSSRK